MAVFMQSDATPYEFFNLDHVVWAEVEQVDTDHNKVIFHLSDGTSRDFTLDVDLPSAVTVALKALRPAQPSVVF